MPAILSAVIHHDRQQPHYVMQREVKRTCWIVIAGDRGLAGGYNSNVFKLAAAAARRTGIRGSLR